MTTQPATQTSEIKPPLPKAVYQVINPLMKALLRSPLHGILSKDLMVLTFQGRKSGKRYSLPVGYLQQGDRLFLFTHSNWWKNLRDGAAVSVRLRGEELQGWAAPLQDPVQKAQVVRDFVQQRGEEMSRRMGIIDADWHPSSSQPPTTPASTILLEIRLEGQH